MKARVSSVPGRLEAPVTKPVSLIATAALTVPPGNVPRSITRVLASADAGVTRGRTSPTMTAATPIRPVPACAEERSVMADLQPGREVVSAGRVKQATENAAPRTPARRVRLRYNHGRDQVGRQDG